MRQRLADQTNSARAVAIEEASAAEVVLTATSSQIPVLHGSRLKANALVLAVGATGSSMRETG